MKKLALAVLAVFVASAAFAGNFGLGLKVGAGQNDLKGDGVGIKLDKNYGFAGAELLYEFGQTGSDRLGLKVGFDIYQEDKVTFGSLEDKIKTYNVPLTLYYKWDRGIGAVSYFLGAGATYVRAEGKWTSKSKGFAHGVLGAEYRFSELFALGADATYNFGAKLEAGTLSDRSGFRGALTARFYF